MNYQNNLAFAKDLDAKDPLNKWRNEFHIPVINGKIIPKPDILDDIKILKFTN